jgi:hypothetical protein
MAPLSTPFRGTRTLWLSLGLALVGGVGWLIGAFINPLRALSAYLTAFTFAVSVALGGLFFLMIAHATGAKWMISVRRYAEAFALAVVPLAFLFAPIALGVHTLYPWAHPLAGASDHTLELLAHKRVYLNAPFFVLRAVAYFALWIFTAVTLARRSRRRDAEPSTHAVDPHRDAAFSCVMLVVVSITTTFAAFDWLMSLEPTWYSSAFGLYFFSGGFVAAIALVTMLACAGSMRGSTPGLVTPQHFHALGRLLFAFTIFWAYIAYFQAFLISIADKPVEVTYYVARVEGDYHYLTRLLIFGQFGLPFLLLLPKALKFRPLYVATVAGLIFVMHYADVVWLVLPALTPQVYTPSVLDLLAPLFVLGTTSACCLWAQRGALLVPEGDPALEAAIHYASTQ